MVYNYVKDLPLKFTYERLLSSKMENYVKDLSLKNITNNSSN
jgi:hypothetical protein